MRAAVVAIARLDGLDGLATLLAEKPWSAQSRAVVAVEPEDSLPPAEATGLEYFLEVNLAQNIAALAPPGARVKYVIY